MIFSYKSSKQNSVNVFLLCGELIDRGQANGILEEIEVGIEKGENKILLNLTDLKYLNSSGLNVIINILTKARKSSGDVAICNVNKKITELLIITKLNSVFNLCESAEEAIEILNK
ncbi:MAG: STAS domain-containing protein [Bacteroidetes bacterium]|nr:STAS domain-containing protein [Bacteroidota bacterium]